jgi:hypothetical protein
VFPEKEPRNQIETHGRDAHATIAVTKFAFHKFFFNHRWTAEARPANEHGFVRRELREFSRIKCNQFKMTSKMFRFIGTKLVIWERQFMKMPLGRQAASFVWVRAQCAQYDRDV